MNVANLDPAEATDLRRAVDKAKRQYTGDEDVAIPLGLRTGSVTHTNPCCRPTWPWLPARLCWPGNRIKKLVLIGGSIRSPSPCSRTSSGSTRSCRRSSLPHPCLRHRHINPRCPRIIHGPPWYYSSQDSYVICLPEVQWSVNGVNPHRRFLSAIDPVSPLDWSPWLT